ncbi:proteinase-activated receptor 2 [Etheostoma spectabile]|uniref:proteinase-activated receptor 2 n=1 Tax=Etheostoma spectabile TaxID=54343 RepID=UPI0013AFABA5|nr:proteinase-activated receptor 2-like [Etheostoma spectabile]
MVPRTRWLHLLLLWCCARTCHCLIIENRGWTGQETDEGVWVNSQVSQVLSSHLTTVFIPIIYIIVFAVGLPTNAMAIWVFLFRTKKRHPSSIYMANLALADLLFVIWIPLKIAYHFNGNNWIYGSACAKCWWVFLRQHDCSIPSSPYRLFSVTGPWSIRVPSAERHPRSCAVSVMVWVCRVLTIPLYLYDKGLCPEPQNPHLHDVTSRQKEMARLLPDNGNCGICLPTGVCIISYILMLKSLKNHGTPIAKRRRKAVVLIITVLVMFLCLHPQYIMLLVHSTLLLVGTDNNLYGFYITTLCLASLNSCFDPFVYYFISEDFRNHVKNTFLCRSERTVERMRVSFSALKVSKKSNTYTSDSGNTRSTEC